MALPDLSGLIALGSLVVAGLGVLVGPYTARKSYEWTRTADEERRKRDEELRRVRRGEEVANDLLRLVDEASMLMTAAQEAPEQREFEAFYYSVRQKAELLTDDAVRARMFEVAESLYFYGQAQQAANGELSRWSIARAYREATHEVLRAYLLGRPCPATPRLTRLVDLIREGGELIAEQLDEEDYADPLDETSGHLSTAG